MKLQKLQLVNSTKIIVTQIYKSTNKIRQLPNLKQSNFKIGMKVWLWYVHNMVGEYLYRKKKRV